MTNLIIDNAQSKAINLIRGVSALMIVLCHVFQGINNELAWWFNVGVQIFLFMSGFLMAKNSINSLFVFIKKRFLRILIPYYVLLIIIFIIYSVLGIKINSGSILTYIFCLQGITYANIIPGLEHLWFISIIIICYVLTLILNIVREKIINNKSVYIITFILLLSTQIVVNYTSLPTAFGARIGAFILGYFIACKSQYSISKKLFINTTILTVITLLIRLYFTYIKSIDSANINNLFNNYFVNWQHTLLGMCIFVSLYYIFSSNKNINNANYKLLNNISKYSYEIYLTHQIFILGPLSILFLSKCIVFNLLIIFILITLFSILINKISIYLKKIILK